MASMNLRKRTAAAKSKKKGWKKVDITELEDFLEDERLQERTGGLVSEKTDDSLFFVDAVPTKKTDETSVPTEPTRKHERRNRPLRCFANLEPDPLIKPARVAHNLKKPRVLARDKRPPTAKELSGKQQRKQVKVEKHKSKVGKWKRTIDYDLWDDPKSEETVDNEHYRDVTKKRRVQTPSYYNKKPSSLPCVELPHPGASYNPSYEDHQELLEKAHEVEAKKLKEKKKLFNALDAQFPSRDQAPTQESWLEEMSAGLATDATREDEVVVPGDDDIDNLSINPPVRREDMKTRTERNKEKRKKREEKSIAKRKEAKVTKNDFNRLKSIKKEIKKREAELVERANRKAELQEKYKNRPRKLGKLKFVEPDLDLKLGGELTGSLRLLKPEGHLLKDRFHSFQKRNIIETREKAKKHKRRRPKVFEKKTHKEITV